MPASERPGPEALAESYEAVVTALTTVPPAQRELVLAKTVLLLVQRLGGPTGLREILATAVRDLPESPLETT